MIGLRIAPEHDNARMFFPLGNLFIYSPISVLAPQMTSSSWILLDFIWTQVTVANDSLNNAGKEESNLPAIFDMHFDVSQQTD